MADQDFNPAQSDIPGEGRGRYRKDRCDEYGERIHAPGGSVIFHAPTIIAGGRDRDDDCDRHGHHGHNERDLPATLPLSGAEQIKILQQQGSAPWWRSAIVSIWDFIRNFWPASYSWSGLNLKADTPLTSLFTVPGRDMLYELVYTITTKVADGGASSGTLTINFNNLNSDVVDAAGSPTAVTQPVAIALNLATATPNGTTGSLTVLLAAGSGVSFSFIGGGTYGAAAYDLIVSAIPKSSDQTVNQATNLLI